MNTGRTTNPQATEPTRRMLIPSSQLQRPVWEKIQSVDGPYIQVYSLIRFTFRFHFTISHYFHLGQYTMITLFWMSLSEPTRAGLHCAWCLYACLLGCLWPLTTSFKWVHLNIWMSMCTLAHAVEGKSEGLLPECMQCQHERGMTQWRADSMKGYCSISMKEAWSEEWLKLSMHGSLHTDHDKNFCMAFQIYTCPKPLPSLHHYCPTDLSLNAPPS